MTYSFACPYPYKREIRVDANDNPEAVEKIIMAGAISCRNIGDHYSCKQNHFDMSLLPGDQLRWIVSLCMLEDPNTEKING
jgi:hypothetical protein